MTDAEIAEFMGWNQQAADRMRDDPDALVGRVHRLVAEVRRREGEGRLPPPLKVPDEVAASMTTADIAWLETRRLVALWTEMGQMRWAGADEGWNNAIEAVRLRLNEECQQVLDWRADVEKSAATAAELLQKMQRLDQGDGA